MNNNEIIKKAQDILGIEYNDVYELIDNLCSEIDRLNEEIEEIKEQYERDIRENYKPLSWHEFYGVNEKDF